MNNIFENAYFGKAYKTRDGRKAVLISYNQRKLDTPYVCAIACYLDNSIKSVCHNFYANGQLHKHESNYDIISECQDPINEEELDRLAREELNLDNITWSISLSELLDAFKAGFQKAKE